MTDLLLTHGYFLYEDPKELQIMKPYVPLGLLYICSHLRAGGFDVEVFDSTFATRGQLFERLRTSPPSVLGVYANLMTRANVVSILRVARQCGWTTVVGGPEPGAYVREYLDAGADVVVLGEGEVTLEELLQSFATSRTPDLGRVNGIAYLGEDGSLRETPPRQQLANLDLQPWPARDAVDIDRYIKVWREAHGNGSVSVITARGCPYKCRWCSHQVFGQTHRRRSPRSVVDEVEWLINTYSPEMLWIADDVFTIHHGWLREYAAEMRRRRIRIPFECITRADRVNAEVADLLASLGCFRVWIGSESGSQRLLDSMERGVTVGEVQSAMALCRERSIQTGMFLMWGYAGEELQDIEATIDHVKRADPDIYFTTVAYPIKGTPYHTQIAADLVMIMPWANSSDRDLVVRSQRPRSYYEVADRLLRDEVELSRARKAGAAVDALQARIRELRAVLQSAEVTA